MKYVKKRAFCLILLILLPFSTHAFGSETTTELKIPTWSFMAYYSRMTTDDLRVILTPRKLHWGAGNLFAVNLSYIPKPDFFLQRWFNYIYVQIEANLNLAYLNDELGNSYQYNPYVSFRWRYFPWNKYLVTSFMLGDGLGITSGVPAKEIFSSRYPEVAKDNINNFFLMQLTFALPTHQDWQLAIVTHHRCPFFHTLNPRTHGASTAYGIGLRYLF